MRELPFFLAVVGSCRLQRWANEVLSADCLTSVRQFLASSFEGEVPPYPFLDRGVLEDRALLLVYKHTQLVALNCCLITSTETMPLIHVGLVCVAQPASKRGLQWMCTGINVLWALFGTTTLRRAVFGEGLLLTDLANSPSGSRHMSRLFPLGYPNMFCRDLVLQPVPAFFTEASDALLRTHRQEILVSEGAVLEGCVVRCANAASTGETSIFARQIATRQSRDRTVSTAYSRLEVGIEDEVLFVAKVRWTPLSFLIFLLELTGLSAIANFINLIMSTARVFVILLSILAHFLTQTSLKHFFAQIEPRLELVISGEARPDHDVGASIFVSNHLGFFDHFVLSSLARTKCKAVSKNSLLATKWLTRAVIGDTGSYILHDREGGAPGRTSESISRSLDSGYDVIIFPEGTSSTDGRPRRLHSGTFRIAASEKRHVRVFYLANHIGDPSSASEGDLSINTDAQDRRNYLELLYLAFSRKRWRFYIYDLGSIQGDDAESMTKEAHTKLLDCHQKHLSGLCIPHDAERAFARTASRTIHEKRL
jgi:1-acyl-sn-glycerol-3-phosphate acyltransferase